MLVLGLDPSTIETGYCYMEDMRFVHSGVLGLPIGDDRTMLRYFDLKIIGLLQQCPGAIMFEHGGFRSHASFQCWSWLFGAVIRLSDCPVYEVYPSSWRAAVLSRERAEREGAVQFVSTQYGLRVPRDITGDKARALKHVYDVYHVASGNHNEAEAVCITASYWTLAKRKKVA